MKTKIFSVKDLCMMAVFTAVIIVMAQIIIPMPYGVPMTLQTLAIPLTGIMLGSKKGALTTVIYVLLGAVGVPVFAGFAGGPGVVFGPTGGFIMSFPVLAYLTGYGAEKDNKWWLWTGLISGVIINYLCGVIYFSFFTSNNLLTSFTVCVLVFIPTDIIKIIITGLFSIKVRNLLFAGNMVK